MNYVKTEKGKIFAYKESEWDSYRFNFSKGIWEHTKCELMDIKTGFDPTEEFPYCFGNLDKMEDLFPLSKEEAEKIIGKKIDESIFE